MSDQATGIAQRLAEVEGRLAAAAGRVRRDPATITLVCVGKTFPAETIAMAVAAGARHLGENRVQEAAAKSGLVPRATWHLIGPLQRNKVRQALEHFDVIHTVDRLELAQRLDRVLAADFPGRRLPVLLEVNIGEEPQKAGVLSTVAGALAREVLGLPQLSLEGLMAIPPFGAHPEASRSFFAALRSLRDRLQDELGVALPELSMGMSDDFEVAIEEGATLVRVGSAIFGPRS